MEVKRCNFSQRFRGLMFRRREKAEALLFDFEKKTNVSLHSFFVFFPFIAVWLDDKNKVLEIKKVSPFRANVSIKKSFSKIIEIPINRKYERFVKNLIFPVRNLTPVGCEAIS